VAVVVQELMQLEQQAQVASVAVEMAERQAELIQAITAQ
jgi:hypothetical protein